MKSRLALAIAATIAIDANANTEDNQTTADGSADSISFAVFEPNEQNQDSSIGVKLNLSQSLYSSNKDIFSGTPTEQLAALRDNSEWFREVDVYLKGNIPFKKDYAISDYLQTGFKASYKYEKLTQDTGYKACEVPASIEYEKLSRCKSHKNDTFIFDAGLHYQFESDSDFEQKNHVYGANLALSYKAYDQTVRYLNPLEWPASLLKQLIPDVGKLKMAKPFDQPYMPRVELSIEQVNPENDEKRKAVIVDDKETYDRARIIIAYATTLFEIVDMGIFRASFTYNHFQELGAKQSIKDADIDSYSYREFAIHTPTNVYISYSKGQLPFDAKDQSHYELGWKYSF